MSDYHSTRLAFDPKRDVVWESLWRYYFSKRISPNSCVLDLGCGYGNFINHVVARRRIAVDSWEGFTTYAAPGVECVVGKVTDLEFLDDSSIDFAFASNIFEHISQSEFSQVLKHLKRKIKPNGRLSILQPNYRYAYREYFDDYTHVSIYSDVSLSDFLEANGFDVIEVIPRFLPLSVKSRLPVSPWLIRGYLASPLKPLGKQMLIHARPSGSADGHES